LLRTGGHRKPRRHLGICNCWAERGESVAKLWDRLEFVSLGVRKFVELREISLGVWQRFTLQTGAQSGAVGFSPDAGWGLCTQEASERHRFYTGDRPVPDEGANLQSRKGLLAHVHTIVVHTSGPCGVPCHSLRVDCGDSAVGETSAGRPKVVAAEQGTVSCSWAAILAF
jgi:hypothetical protein